MAIMQVADLIVADDFRDSDDYGRMNKSLAIYLKASAKIGNASFTMDKETGKADGVQLKLASLKEIKSVLTVDDHEVLKFSGFVDELAGKTMAIEPFVFDGFGGVKFDKVGFVAMEDFSADEPKGTRLGSFFITKETSKKIEEAYAKAIALENSDIKPRGGIEPK